MKANTIMNGIARKEKGGVGLPRSSAETPSDEGHSMVVDPEQQHQASCVTFEGLKEGELGPMEEERVSGLLSPGPEESTGLLVAWGENTDQMEATQLDATEESSVGWGSHEVTENGVVMSSSDQEREGRGALVLNGNIGRDGGNMGLDQEGIGSSGIVSKGEEEVGSTKVDHKFQLDWDLGGILEGKIWDEAGEMWPWQWDSVNRGLGGLQRIEGCGYQEESLDGWLLSDVL